MKIAVTSPLYINNRNHRDFLFKFTQSIRTKHEWAFIPVENYVAAHFKPIAYSFTQNPEELWVTEGKQPQSVSRGWNRGIEKGIEIGAKYILVCNNDIILKSNAIDRLVDFAEAHPDFAIWSMGQAPDLFSIESCEEDENWSEHPNFSCFMVRNDFFEHVGKFDENIIPAYYEDNDMHARLALANKKAVIYGGARFYHFGSATMRSDSDWHDNVRPTAVNCQQYFIKKWGRNPVHEAEQMREVYFKHPWNDTSKSLKDW